MNRIPTTAKESARLRSVSLTRASARAGDIAARSLVAMGAIHRQTGERTWEGVEAVAYDDPAGAVVGTGGLIGPADGAPHYRLRHFHVPAGGRTARESHPHDHGVVIVARPARLTLGEGGYQGGAGA